MQYGCSGPTGSRTTSVLSLNAQLANPLNFALASVSAAVPDEVFPVPLGLLHVIETLRVLGGPGPNPHWRGYARQQFRRGFMHEAAEDIVAEVLLPILETCLGASCGLSNLDPIARSMLHAETLHSADKRMGSTESLATPSYGRLDNPGTPHPHPTMNTIAVKTLPNTDTRVASASSPLLRDESTVANRDDSMG